MSALKTYTWNWRRAFEDIQVEYLVIKGFAQYPGYVKDPRLRMQSDIDIYCPSESIFRARDQLLSLGYHPLKGLEQLPVDHLPAMNRKTGWEWRGNAFDPEMPPSVELHFCLWNEATARFASLGLEDFWPRRVARQLDDFSFPGLHPVDNLGFSALHALRDLLSGDWVLHRIYEMARFLHTSAKDKAFWTEWKETHSDSLRSREAISFRLARDWFACDLSEEVEAEVRNLSPGVQQWFHAFSRGPLEGMFHTNKDGVWLHVALLESSRDKRAVLRNALMPMRIPTVGAPGQDTTRQGLRKRFWPSPSHRYTHYFFYVTSRLAYHARTLAPTLLRGARWWLATKKLGRQFWTFFATSFFLDFGMSVFFFPFQLLPDRNWIHRQTSGRRHQRNRGWQPGRHDSRRPVGAKVRLPENFIPLFLFGIINFRVAGFDDLGTNPTWPRVPRRRCAVHLGGLYFSSTGAAHK